MKKVLTTIFVMLVCCVCMLTACTCSSALGNNPDKLLETFGNGGLAVVKGEYLYYVNGYEEYTNFIDVRKDNKFGDIDRSAIYRTKLVDGKVVRDENGFLQETECVVPQCVGFDKGGFYIIGDYIYYLTPHMENRKNEETNEKELKNNWVDICRINIDGTKKTRLNYTIHDERISDWSVYTIDGKIYVVVIDGTSIISIDGETGDKVTMVENFAKAKLFKQENYTFGSTDLVDGYKYVYYSREYTVDDEENGLAGNKICRVEIGTNNEETIVCDAINNYELLDVVNGRIYYSKVRDSQTGSWTKEVFRKGLISNTAEEKVCGSYTSYAFLDNGDDTSLTNNAIVVDATNNIYVIENGERKEPIYKGANTITIIGVDDYKVYFLENEEIYSLSFVEEDSVPTQLTKTDKTYKLEDANLIDFDGRRIFVMAEYTASNGETHFYLNIIDRYDTESKSDFVGKFADKETPAEPEEKDSQEDLEEEKEIWIK